MHHPEHHAALQCQQSSVYIIQNDWPTKLAVSRDI